MKSGRIPRVIKMIQESNNVRKKKRNRYRPAKRNTKD